MKFVLNESVYRCGDTETRQPEDLTKYSDAALFTYDAKSVWCDHAIRVESYAALDDNSDPVLKRRRIYSKPPKAWYETGRDHKQIEDDENGNPQWQRIDQRQLTYIEIADLQSLVALYRKCGYLDFDADEFTIDNTTFAGTITVHA